MLSLVVLVIFLLNEKQFSDYKNKIRAQLIIISIIIVFYFFINLFIYNIQKNFNVISILTLIVSWSTAILESTLISAIYYLPKLCLYKFIFGIKISSFLISALTLGILYIFKYHIILIVFPFLLTILIYTLAIVLSKVRFLIKFI